MPSVSFGKAASCMKPSPKDEAGRWLKQAGHVLKVAQTLLRDECYAECCFHAEQTAQLALKAFLYGQGERFVTLHSVKQLVERCATYDPAFLQVIDAGKVLDQYYIPTRYPDAIGFPGVPYETYTARQANEAVQLAETLMRLVRSNV